MPRDRAWMRWLVLSAIVLALDLATKEWVSSVDNGPREATQFFEKHKHLYADLADVEQRCRGNELRSGH